MGNSTKEMHRRTFELFTSLRSNISNLASSPRTWTLTIRWLGYSMASIEYIVTWLREMRKKNCASRTVRRWSILSRNRSERVLQCVGQCVSNQTMDWITKAEHVWAVRFIHSSGALPSGPALPSSSFPLLFIFPLSRVCPPRSFNFYQLVYVYEQRSNVRCLLGATSFVRTIVWTKKKKKKVPEEHFRVIFKSKTNLGILWFFVILFCYTAFL